MASATEQLTKVQDQIIEVLGTMQRPVVELAKRIADRAESFVPEMSRSEKVPTLDELVVNQFAFAEKVLANQKEFADALLEAIKPVSAKVAAEPKPKPRAATAKAAA